MKIRTGFVSNSSSSSFCLFGVQLEWDKFVNYLKKNKLIKKTAPEDENDDSDVYEEDDLFDTLESLGYPYCEDYDNDVIYFGKSPEEMGEDETRGQFETRVQQELKEKFGKLIKGKPYWICETIYN